MDLTSLKQQDLALVGSRLTLSPLGERDFSGEYLSWLNDPEVFQFLETRWQIQTEETVRAHIRNIENSPNQLLLKISKTNSNQHIGNIKIGPIDINHHSAELSYFVGAKSSWGNGYATEAIGLCIEFGFKALGIHKFQAGCYEHNIGSQRALQKAGFELEGCLKKRCRDVDGNWQDHLWYGIIRS